MKTTKKTTKLLLLLCLFGCDRGPQLESRDFCKHFDIDGVCCVQFDGFRTIKSVFAPTDKKNINCERLPEAESRLK